MSAGCSQHDVTAFDMNFVHEIPQPERESIGSPETTELVDVSRNYPFAVSCLSVDESLTGHRVQVLGSIPQEHLSDLPSVNT